MDGVPARVTGARPAWQAGSCYNGGMAAPHDTRPEIQRLLNERLREMPAWRKLALLDDLNALARALLVGRLRQEHPTASPAELRLLLAIRLYGEPLARRICEAREKQ